MSKLNNFEFTRLFDALAIEKIIDYATLANHINIDFLKNTHEQSPTIQKHLLDNFVTSLFLAMNKPQQGIRHPQVQFLLNFLIHHHIEIHLGQESYPLAQILEKGSSPLWIHPGQYPTLESLHIKFVEHAEVHDFINLFNQLDMHDPHSFDNTVLNFQDFFLTIESFLTQARVHIDAISLRLKDLIDPALQQELSALQTPPVEECFLSISPLATFMQKLVQNAKNSHCAEHQFAAQILLGFLMHHNFKLHYGEQDIAIEDLVNAYISSLEKAAYAHSLVDYPFANRDWRLAQNYPGKIELEQAINHLLEQEKGIPMDEEYKTFLPFYHSQSATMDIQETYELTSPPRLLFK